MTTNAYMGTQVVIDAATALAKMMLEHQKPLAFNMQEYAAVAVGLIHPNGPDLLDAIEAAESLSGLALEEQDLDNNLRKRLADAQKLALDKSDFAEAMSDAFTIDEVADIAKCCLVEAGWTECTELDAENDVWLYYLIFEPKIEDCFIVHL